jgi:hypothetical protein
MWSQGSQIGSVLIWGRAGSVPIVESALCRSGGSEDVVGRAHFLQAEARTGEWAPFLVGAYTVVTGSSGAFAVCSGASCAWAVASAYAALAPATAAESRGPSRSAASEISGLTFPFHLGYVAHATAPSASPVEKTSRSDRVTGTAGTFPSGSSIAARNCVRQRRRTRIELIVGGWAREGCGPRWLASSGSERSD